MKVSIVTVCYNSAHTIKKTIESLLNQSTNNFEYILVDGKSTDNTVEIIKSYTDKFKEKGISYRYISEPDNGIYDAMNKGIQNSTGELIGMINSDDWYEPHTIETAIGEHLKNPEALIYGMLKIYKNNKLYRIRQNTHHFINENMFQHPTWFVPKTIYLKHGLYDTSYSIGGDYEMANRLIKANVPIIRIEKILANFSLGGISENTSTGNKEWLQIMYKYGHIDTDTYLRKTNSIKKRSLLDKLKTIVLYSYNVLKN